jgi:hypothetical protein
MPKGYLEKGKKNMNKKERKGEGSKDLCAWLPPERGSEHGKKWR